MTFLEAAIEVLRGSEGPLHYKEISREAVDRKLLSHVGRDPDAAMQTCLNQAVRAKVHDGVVMRSKPGHYKLRPGVPVPELPPPPSEPEPIAVVQVPEPSKRPSKKKTKKTATKAAPSSKTSSKKVAASSDKKASKKAPVRRRRSAAREEPKADAPLENSSGSMEAIAPSAGDGPGAGSDTPELSAKDLPPADLDPSKVRFHGPQGSGLEGDTDVTLVMANAVSRLVDERPDLKEELDAMQKGQAPVPEVIEVGRKRRRDEEERNSRESEERGGRRRKRRRRKNRRVDWSEGNNAGSGAAQGEEILDRVAAILGEAGSRSLHVRQIAENLASHGVLGGEISEIERAVTATLLLDVHARGESSRFAVRGDARYQLRGARLPEKAAAAEQAARASILALEKETRNQLLLWLQSLGARSLESLVRMYLDREGYRLTASLPPSRGLGKLIAEDPEADEDDARTLILVVPRKTSLEPKLWDGEAERNGCSATLVFAMCGPRENAGNDARVIRADDFARWLERRGIGVRQVRFEASVLDPGLIESIAGLDT